MTIKLKLTFIAAAMIASCMFGDSPRRMIGTASGTSGAYSEAMSWAAEDGGTVIKPWEEGSNTCVYVIKSTSKIKSAATFPDVPFFLDNSASLNCNATTFNFPQLTIMNGAEGFRVNMYGTLILNGNYTIPSDSTFPLYAQSSAGTINASLSNGGNTENLTLLGTAESTLTGDASTKVTYKNNSINTEVADGVHKVYSTMTIAGDASAFKGKYEMLPSPTDTSKGICGYTFLVLESATAFGDPTSAFADAVTLNERTYLKVGASVTQSAARGVTVAAGKTGGVYADDGEEWSLSAPVTCGTGATFEKYGTGMVTLSGNCSGMPTAMVTEGTLVLGAGGQFASGLAVTVKSGATLVQNLPVSGIAVTCEEGGTYIKEFIVPYSNATGISTPLDLTATMPELPVSFRLSESVQIASFAPDFTAKRILVARLPSGTMATPADFADATVKTYGLPKTSFELADGDGCKELYLVARPVVWSLSELKNGSSKVGNGINGTAENWANNAVVQSGYDYLLTNNVKYTGSYTASSSPQFNGDSLTVANVNQFKLTSPGVDVGDAAFYGTVKIFYNSATMTHGFTGITGGTINIAKDARVDLQTRQASSNNAIMTNCADVAVSGEGDLYAYAYAAIAGGMPVYLTGDNSGWSGRLVVTCSENAAETTGTTLHLGLGTSIGGDMAEAKEDGILLAQYSFLHPEQTMTFNAVNRGILIKAGGFDVPEDVALTVALPVSVTGNAIKKGAGELALSGSFTFASGRYLAVKEGSVRALSDEAVAGNFRFTDGTTIILDPAANLENGFTGSFSVIGEGSPKVNVAVDAGSAAFNPETPITLPICTLPSSAGDMTDSFAVSNVRRCKAELVTETVTVDGVECVRYSVRCMCRGFAVSFR